MVVLLAGLAGTAVGCRSEPPMPAAEEEPSTLTIGMDQWSDRIFGGRSGRLMYLPLVAINERGELEGRLAQSWELSDDSTWTIRLRSDIRWHDRVPVTAHDIKFTMDLYQHPDMGQWSPGSRKATVLDDTTFTWIIQSDFIGEEMNEFRSRFYLPKHLLEGLDPATFRRWDFWRAPVGNGPYRFVRRVPQAMLELEANPDFYLGRPRIDRVILKRAGVSAAELLGGNVDVMFFSDATLAAALGEDPRFRVYHQNVLGDVFGIAWNQNRYAPFRDRRVRQALTRAIDRRELNKVIDRPVFAAIFDAPMSDRQFRRGEFMDPVPYDPETARRLLEEAGWRDEDGNGIRERDGEEFRFTMMAGRVRSREAVYVQDALRRVGIAMEIDMRTEGILFSDTEYYDARVIRWFLTLRRGNIRMGTWLGRDSPIGYHNPSADSLIQRARRTRNPDELDAIYRELMPILREDLPVTFLFSRTDAYVAHRRVRGLSSPWRAEPYLYADQLWLEDEP